jgi:hypothetical protein
VIDFKNLFLKDLEWMKDLRERIEDRFKFEDLKKIF